MEKRLKRWKLENRCTLPPRRVHVLQTLKMKTKTSQGFQTETFRNIAHLSDQDLQRLLCLHEDLKSEQKKFKQTPGFPCRNISVTQILTWNTGVSFHTFLPWWPLDPQRTCLTCSGPHTQIHGINNCESDIQRFLWCQQYS